MIEVVFIKSVNKAGFPFLKIIDLMAEAGVVTKIRKKGTFFYGQDRIILHGMNSQSPFLEIELDIAKSTLISSFLHFSRNVSQFALVIEIENVDPKFFIKSPKMYETDSDTLNIQGHLDAGFSADFHRTIMGHIASDLEFDEIEINNPNENNWAFVNIVFDDHFAKTKIEFLVLPRVENVAAAQIFFDAFGPTYATQSEDGALFYDHGDDGDDISVSIVGCDVLNRDGFQISVGIPTNDTQLQEAVEEITLKRLLALETVRIFKLVDQDFNSPGYTVREVVLKGKEMVYLDARDVKFELD